ncbi:unnamed protein product [Caenorhabditis bovis]|uniref:Ground-like domain-containing protein n=1 Tax=Caenorhabditis bovis TaxID=2654633 RepID=A0A8S1E875_9PELO|nr:unnamed protein product [Caenorhabditis bovis]
MRRVAVALLGVQLFAVAVNGFLFIGPSCGCTPSPACPYMPISCNQKPIVHSAKTVAQQPIPVYSVPDDLDLRAAAFGVPLVPQELPSTFEILHNLGDLHANSPSENPVVDGNSNTDYVPRDNDEDLTVIDNGGLVGSKDIRRSPQPTIHVHQDVEDSTSNVSEPHVEENLDLNKCNSQVLKKLMLENMNDSSAESKKKINAAAEIKLGGNVDVICSRGHFSYIFTSNLFCEASKGLTTCIAFRQAEKITRN